MTFSLLVTKIKKIAQKRLLESGAQEIKDLPRGEKYIYKDNYYDMLCWSGSVESLANAKTPEEMIKLFDFTIGMAALDNKGNLFVILISKII